METQRRNGSNKFNQSNMTTNIQGKTKDNLQNISQEVHKEPETIQDEVQVTDEVQNNNETNIDKLKDNQLDITAIFNFQKKPKSSSHSLYIDDDIYKKLEHLAKSQKISISKALNEILKSIL